jgi:hypothetical protein
LTTRTALELRYLCFLRSALGPAAGLQKQRSNGGVLIHPVPHIQRHPQILSGPQIVVRLVWAVHGCVMFAFGYRPVISMSVQQRRRKELTWSRPPGHNLGENTGIRARRDAKELRSLRGATPDPERRQRRAMHHPARRSLRVLLLSLRRKEFIAWRTERGAPADRRATSEVNLAVEPQLAEEERVGKAPGANEQRWQPPALIELVDGVKTERLDDGTAGGFERPVTQKLRKDIHGLLVQFCVNAHPHEGLEHAHVRPRQKESRVTELVDAGSIVVEAVCPKTADQESAG